MSITVGIPVRAATTGAMSLTFSNFPVTAANQLLVVALATETNIPANVSTIKFGGVDLAKKAEGQQTGAGGALTNIIGYWCLANPAVSTADIVITFSTSLACTAVAFLVDGADLTGGLASAVNAVASFGSSSGAAVAEASINPTVAGCVILDGATVNDPTFTLTANNGQTLVYGEQYSPATGWTYKLGQLLRASAGAVTLGYTCSTTYVRGSYAAIAIAPAAAGSPTLSDLTISWATVNAVAGETWSATVNGKTSGSSVAILFDDGTQFTASSGTASGTFPTAGLKTLVSITETLSGATNTPHVSNPSFTTRILIQIKVGVAGSSTPHHWTGIPGSPSIFNTTEAANSRLYCWNYAGAFVPFYTYVAAGKGPGGVAFGNYLLAKLGPNYRVDLVNGSTGGTFLHTDWDTASAAYNNAVSVFNAAGGIDLLVFHGGSNDARGDAVPGRVAHETRYRTFISNLRASLSMANLKVFIMGCQRWAAAAADATDDLYWARARGAEQNVADDTNVYLGATCVDLPLYVDDVHLSEAHDGGNAVEARRAAHAVYNVMYGGTQRYTGPKPGSATYDPATGWIRISFTTYGGAELVGRTGQTGLTGFLFFAGGSPVTPVTAPFVSGGGQVAARLATGLSSVTYSYQEGHAPDVTNPLFDNGLAPVEP